MAAANLGTSIWMILKEDPTISLNELDKKLNGPPPKRKTGKKIKKEWREYPRQDIAAELKRLLSVEKPNPSTLKTLKAESVQLNDEIVSYLSDIHLYSTQYSASNYYYAIRKLHREKGIELLGRLKILILDLREHGDAAKEEITQLKSQEKSLEEIDQMIERQWEILERTDAGKAMQGEVTLKELANEPLEASFTHFVL